MIAPPRALVRGIALACAALCAEGALAIEKRLEGGQVVYVSRPTRKPAPGTAQVPGAGATIPKSGAHLAPMVREVSHKYGLDPGLVATVISVESGFNHRAVSPKGARGLMQLMPATAKEYGVQDVYDPRANLEGGVAYLRDLLRRYNGDLRLALAAYNAGPDAVQRASGVPNFRETIDYLRKIEARYGRRLSLPAEGGSALRSAGRGEIRVARNSDGEIVATNAPTVTIRKVPRSRRGR